MDPRIFKTLPQDLSTLTLDELNAAITERQQLAAKVNAEDPATVPADQFTADDVLFELAAAADQIEKLQAEVAARDEAVGEYERQKAELAAKIGVTLSSEEPEAPAEEPEPAEEAAETVEEPAEPTDVPEAVADPETVAAAAAPRQVRRPSLPAPTPDREPVVVEAEPISKGLVAAAEFVDSPVKGGQRLTRRTLAELMIAADRRIGATPGQRTEVVVASAKWDAPEERLLRHNDGDGNADKILNVVPYGHGEDSLVASGGLCAPLTPIYSLPQISSEVRPIRDNLPAFQAERGGITFAVPPSIADVTDAVGLITAEEDAQGGTFATKSCQFLDCQDFDSAEIAAIYHCLEWGNIGSRAWPERVAQFTDVVMAAWSRLAETNILNLFKAGSTQVTAAAATYGYGALSSFTSEILAAAAGYRSRFRMDPASRFRVVAPQWVRDLVLSDLINSQFDRFALNYDGVDAFFRSRGIDPVWTLDGENGGGQIFDAQPAGALLSFPDTVKWFLFPEGTWIWVTMGTLELGIVRDSTLNAVNDFQVFGEGFETVAKVGYQSLEITSTLCPNGSTGGPATLITCS